MAFGTARVPLRFVTTAPPRVQQPGDVSVPAEFLHTSEHVDTDMADDREEEDDEETGRFDKDIEVVLEALDFL